MTPLLYYDADGRIIQTASIDAPEFNPEIPGLAWMLGTADPRTEYVLDGAVVPRPALVGFDRLAIAADGADTATLTGLPQPCTVTINGAAYEVTDGTLEITAALPGLYRVQVDRFPYQPFQAEVSAT